MAVLLVEVCGRVEGCGRAADASDRVPSRADVRGEHSVEPGELLEASARALAHDRREADAIEEALDVAYQFVVLAEYGSVHRVGDAQPFGARLGCDGDDQACSGHDVLR